VVATAVGGIAEQVNGLGDTNGLSFGWKVYGPEHATGILVPPGQAEAMAFGIEYLLRDESRLRQIGKNATETAQRRFDLQRQVDQYLEWYSEILKGLAASRRHRDERTGVR
jgi:glycosyltransferase involved in cell wall biosynthesis